MKKILLAPAMLVAFGMPSQSFAMEEWSKQEIQVLDKYFPVNKEGAKAITTNRHNEMYRNILTHSSLKDLLKLDDTHVEWATNIISELDRAKNVKTDDQYKAKIENIEKKIQNYQGTIRQKDFPKAAFSELKNCLLVDVMDAVSGALPYRRLSDLNDLANGETEALQIQKQKILLRHSWKSYTSPMGKLWMAITAMRKIKK